MTTIMIVVGSVRPGRAGLPVAEWVRSHLERQPDVEIDFVDLAELALPLMDEPEHPAKHQYTQQHTIAWSARVAAADAFVFVTPEYNHSYAPALKNAIDYLHDEWWRKAVSFVSYGGISAGTRAVVAMLPVIGTCGLVKTAANVEIPFVGTRIVDDMFEPTEKESNILDRTLVELIALTGALAPLRPL